VHRAPAGFAGAIRPRLGTCIVGAITLGVNPSATPALIGIHS
jgi:hypothetical protein